MNTDLLVIFVLLTIINVIVQTAKSIITVKCGKIPAAVANAVGYGLQTIVTIYTLCDLPLWWKVGIVAACNLLGVFLVKWFEERSRKDKLWKIECTIPHYVDLECIKKDCEELQISYNYVDIQKYYLFNFYCPTGAETDKVKELLKKYPVKYFVTEHTSLGEPV